MPLSLDSSHALTANWVFGKGVSPLASFEVGHTFGQRTTVNVQDI